MDELNHKEHEGHKDGENWRNPFVIFVVWIFVIPVRVQSVFHPWLNKMT